MGKETFYRFELSFAGKEQGVGILQGLDDTPIPFVIRDELFSVFDSLPVPRNISTPDDSQVVFWFTEKGLQQYANVINAIIQELEVYDWQVVAMPLVVDSDTPNTLSMQYALYKDEFQVAFSRSDILDFTYFDFKEIACVDINLDNPLVFNNAMKEEYFMKAVDIEWDVDCQEDLEDLPTEIKIPEGLEDEEDISDYISDVTGFCHKGFRLVENEKDKIVLDFGNIVSELETKDLKLLKIKDNNSLFVVDCEDTLYGIEPYYAGGYLDRFIGEKFIISFERMEQPTRNFEDWRKEFMDASWVKSFIERVVEKEYPNFTQTHKLLTTQIQEAEARATAPCSNESPAKNMPSQAR